MTIGSVLAVVGCASGASGSSSTTSLAPGSSVTDAVVAAPASATTAPDTTVAAPTIPTARFVTADRLLQDRVRQAGLGGGVLLVGRGGTLIHRYAVGSVSASTPLLVASSAKWLTAATVMTYVDDGTVGLDDPVGRWLPELAGQTPPVTVRELLVHTSGIGDQPCLWNTGGRLDDCVRLLARSPRQFPAGTRFSYGNADFHVIGRVLEVVGGADFATVFQRRIGGPLGMTSTTWPGAPNNPSPAAGARSTVNDYARFLAMILGRGMVNGQRLLSEAAVAELIGNQVGGYDLAHDGSVAITRIARYALGAWPDVVDARGATVVVSGNGGRGFYPWVDFSTNSYGIIGVQDDRGAPVAVPASQKVEVAARAALAG